MITLIKILYRIICHPRTYNLVEIPTDDGTLFLACGKKEAIINFETLLWKRHLGILA